MTPEEYMQNRPHTLSRLNKSLCWLLVVIMTVMCLSYYITTLLQVRLTDMSKKTSKVNNENVDLQNRLDKLLSFNNIEALVRNSGKLDTAKQVIEIDPRRRITPLKTQKVKNERNYYRWSLGF